MKTLNEIFLECHTDKAADCHDYARMYEMFFEPMRNSPRVSLLEIGIDSGFSMRAWHKYFTNGKISGIDLRGNYEYLISEGCYATYIVDQSDELQLKNFNEEHRDEYSIIIDDGSHNCADQIKSFEILFEGLQVGGFYCIEDELCSYDSRWNQGANTYDRVRQMIGEVSYNGKMNTGSLCSNKMGEVHKYSEQLTYFEAHIEWIHQSCGLTIIKKM